MVIYKTTQPEVLVLLLFLNQVSVPKDLRFFGTAIFIVIVISI
jgi:hypothetical protein